MDNQKDFYIKSKFKEDELISKNADDVFNNFLRGTMKMEDEKVVNINSTKEKSNKKEKFRKILSIAATFMIIFIGANVYAATQGYNNIFFIINNLFNPTEITDVNEILKDRDITISYQSIGITEDFSIQINRLVVKDNEALLYLDVDNGGLETTVSNYAVYDITDGKKELIGNQIAKTTIEERYTEEIKLVNFSNNTKVLQLDLLDSNYKKIVSLEINLDKKEINILGGVQKDLEKISEVELKEFLADIVRINFFEDKDSVTKYHTVEEYRDEIKVLYALELLDTEKASVEDVHKVIKEFTGDEIIEPLSLANIVVTNSGESYKYVISNREHEVHALCLEVSDIVYSDGIYTVDCVYTYPTKAAYKNNTIEDLPRYETTIKLKLNEDYEYVKYCLVEEFKGKLIEQENDVEDDVDTVPDNSNAEKEENTENNKENTNNAVNNNSNTNTVSPTVPNNSNNTSVTVTINPKEEVDNYASTMEWETFYTPGLRGRIPVIFGVERYKEYYSGEQDNGLLATTVSGVARGINKETNEIIDSNLTINFYMPEFVDASSSFNYSTIIAARENLEATDAGYTSSLGMDWKIVTEPYSNRTLYCHYEPMGEGEKGVGYVVEIICDNYENYKVTNILNWMFGELKGASF